MHCLSWLALILHSLLFLTRRTSAVPSSPPPSLLSTPPLTPSAATHAAPPPQAASQASAALGDWVLDLLMPASSANAAWGKQSDSARNRAVVQGNSKGSPAAPPISDAQVIFMRLSPIQVCTLCLHSDVVVCCPGGFDTSIISNGMDALCSAQCLVV